MCQLLDHPHVSHCENLQFLLISSLFSATNSCCGGSAWFTLQQTSPYRTGNDIWLRYFKRNRFAIYRSYISASLLTFQWWIVQQLTIVIALACPTSLHTHYSEQRTMLNVCHIRMWCIHIDIVDWITFSQNDTLCWRCFEEATRSCLKLLKYMHIM